MRRFGIAAIILLAVVQAQAQEPSFGEKVPVADLLREDGSLDLTTGFSGTLDLAGFTMTTGENGAPRFVSARACRPVRPG